MKVSLSPQTILLVLLLLNTFPLVREIAGVLKIDPQQDEVLVSERKFQALRRLLPGNALLGYIADGEVTRASEVQLDACRRFYFTQYALVPNIVVHDTKRPLVVGNFEKPESAPAEIKAAGLHIIHDFGGGLFLLSGEESK